MKAAAGISSLAVVPVAHEDLPAASAVAQRLGLPLVRNAGVEAALEPFDALLLQSGDRLALRRTGRGAPGAVEARFGGTRRRRGSGRELLGRAVGAGHARAIHVLDATAGLGRDAFVLAGLGCNVRLCERHPVVAALLGAGLTAARHCADQAAAGAVSRMRLRTADARSLTAHDLAAIEVICLDPMFPQRDKSAAVKKEMALFHSLLGTAQPGEAEDLLRWALAQDVARVVVKRPSRAPVLGDTAPSHCIAGKTVRYDVYVRRALAND